MQSKTEIKPSNDRFAALRYKDFRFLWAGQFISIFGRQIQMVAVNWHIYLLTNSAIALGLVGLMRFVPIIIFSLIGGSAADVFNRKKIMLASQIFLAIFASILAITTFTGSVNPAIIYIVVILSATAASFDTPSRQALIPNLVEKKHLTNAMSLNVIMFQTSLIVGPLAAGLILAKYNIGVAYSIDAITYVASILSIALIKTSGKVQGGSAVFSLGSIKEGLVFVKSKKIIWSTMVLDFFSTFFASTPALFPIFAKDILKIGPQGLGMLHAAPSIGAVVTGFILAQMKTLSNQGRILLISISFYAIATITFGISKSLPLSLFALFLVGAGDSVSTIIRNTIRQIATPDYIRGRMTSINMIFFMGGPQLGEFQAGLLTAFIGAPLAVAFGGTATLVVVGVMAISVPVLRRYNNHTTDL
jgi:MFS family permease